MERKTALITGNGQDANHLARVLLLKDYDVVIATRRSGSDNGWRAKALMIDSHPRLKYEYMDLMDQESVTRTVKKYIPDELYHLAAQSFVGSSFDMPVSTSMTNAIGTLYILEAIKEYSRHTRMYNASTSEMFGNTGGQVSDESSRFVPRSPYGVAKLFAHEMVKNYRESYGMFCCSGILFNHESVPKNSPVILKDENSYIDILPIEDLFRNESHRYEGILNKYYNQMVWNGSEWTRIIAGTTYRDQSKPMKLVQTVSSSYEATNDHVSFKQDNTEILTRDWKVGDKVFNCSYPMSDIKVDLLSPSFSRFLGFVVGDGCINEEGKIRLIGTDKKMLISIATAITDTYNWTYRISEYLGGWENCVCKPVYHLDILNDRSFGKWIRSEIYTNHSAEKKVPRFVLNASPDIKQAFFDGYYLADGRKQGNERYLYKGFTTASATLCLGLNYIFTSFSEQAIKTKCKVKDNRRYYYTQYGTPNPNGKGEHLRKNKCEVIRIEDVYSDDGWFFDIQTESGTFCTGPNLFKIHNSPIRGEEFVTRKITKGFTDIAKGNLDVLSLGNLYSKRDWGYAGDFVYAMWLMLQSGKPEDYVIATGQTHTIKEFVEEAVKNIWGDDFRWEGEDVNEKLFVDNRLVLKIDPKFYRPAEVDFLLGNASRARRELGWKPVYDFRMLVEVMCKYDFTGQLSYLV